MPSSLRQSGSSAVNFFFLLDIITCFTGILILFTLLLATQIDPNENDVSETGDRPDPALQEKLAGLLDQLSVLNTRNQTSQQKLAEAEATPNSALLRDEIRELRERISIGTQQEASLHVTLASHKEEEAKRDEILGLSDLRRDAQKVKDQIKGFHTEVGTLLDHVRAYEAKVVDAQAQLLKVKNQRNKVWVIPEASRTSKEPLLVTVAEKEVTIERFNKPDSKIVKPRLNSKDEFSTALKGFNPLDYYIVFYVKPSGILTFEKLKEAAQDANYEIGYDALGEETEIVFSEKE